MSDNIPRPPASQNMSESKNIKQPRAEVTVSIPNTPNIKPVVQKSPGAPAKVSTTPNYKASFGTPKKMK